MALKTYHFTLVAVPPQDAEDIDLLLFRGGCTDATVTIRGEEAWIDFARVATTQQSALISAQRNVEQLGFSVRRVEKNEEA